MLLQQYIYNIYINITGYPPINYSILRLYLRGLLKTSNKVDSRTIIDYYIYTVVMIFYTNIIELSDKYKGRTRLKLLRDYHWHFGQSK
jgi:hypothetical protein